MLDLHEEWMTIQCSPIQSEEESPFQEFLICCFFFCFLFSSLLDPSDSYLCTGLGTVNLSIDLVVSAQSSQLVISFPWCKRKH